MVPLVEGPIAVGVSDEIVSFFEARGLRATARRRGRHGGHHRPRGAARELREFLAAKLAAGLGIDPKIYAGLFLVGVVLPV